MGADLDQAGDVADVPVSEELLERARKIPYRVQRDVMLFRATGGYKFMQAFKSSEVEVRKAAKSVEAQMCSMRLRLMVAEDLLRNSSILDRCIETYEERMTALVSRLASEGRGG